MTSDEIDYSGAARGVVAVLHEKGIPISKVSRVFEEAMSLVDQYMIPFDPSSLATADASTSSEEADTSGTSELSDEEANDKALKMMGV